MHLVEEGHDYSCLGRGEITACRPDGQALLVEIVELEAQGGAEPSRDTRIRAAGVGDRDNS